MSNLVNGFEPLQKIQYTSIEDFVRDLNKNFAIIQNSPLFKGIPGMPGESGAPGKQGLRGSSLLFVDTKKFIKYFKGTVQITLEWLNNNRSTNESLQNIARALDIEYLIHNDLIVLVDSKIIRYDAIDNVFVDTGKKLNGNNDVQMNIENMVQTSVAAELSKIKRLQTSTELIGRFESNGKNIVGSGIHVNDTISDSTLIYPEAKAIQVFDSGSNVSIEKVAALKHYFYGIEGEDRSTQVIGGITRLLKVLNDGTQDVNVTTEGTINRNALPSAIIVQNDAKSGLLIGQYGETPYQNNIHKFASIYKNEFDELVIKSHNFVGNKNSPHFSTLTLRSDQTHFNKDVVVDGLLNATDSLRVGGEFNSKYIRSGKFITNADNSVTDAGNFELGTTSAQNWLRFISSRIQTTAFKNGVILTDKNGWWSVATVLQPTDITSPTYRTNVKNALLGSEALNKILEFIDKNTDAITKTVTKQSLADGFNLPVNFVANEGSFGSIQWRNPKLTINATDKNLEITGSNIKFPAYTNTILSTSADGSLVNAIKLYSLEPWSKAVAPTIVEIQHNQKLKENEENTLVTGKHFNWLLKQFESQSSSISGDYYTKNQVSRTGIDNLVVTGRAQLPGSIDLGTELATFNKGVKFAGNVTMSNLTGGHILSLDGSNNVRTVMSVLQTLGGTPNQMDAITGDANKILNATHLSWLLEKIKYVNSELTTKYVTKASLTDRTIQTINVGGSITSQSGTIGGIKSEQNEVSVTAGTLKLTNPGGKEALLSVLPNGVVEKKFEIDSNMPNLQGSVTDEQMVPQTALAPSNFVGIPSIKQKISDSKIITGNIFKWLTDRVMDMSKRFANTFNKQETVDELYKHVPAGSIIIWTYQSSVAYGKPGQIPTGWAVCDGQNGTPDMRGTMVRMESTSLRENDYYGGRALSDMNKNIVPGTTNYDYRQGWTEEGIAIHPSMFGDVHAEVDDAFTGPTHTHWVELGGFSPGNAIKLAYENITDQIDNKFEKVFGTKHVKGGQQNNVRVEGTYPTKSNGYSLEKPGGAVEKTNSYSRIYTGFNKHIHYHHEVLRNYDSRFSGINYTAHLREDDGKFTNLQWHHRNDVVRDESNSNEMSYGGFVNLQSVQQDGKWANYKSGTRFEKRGHVVKGIRTAEEGKNDYGTFIPLNLQKSFDDLCLIVRDNDFFGGGNFLEPTVEYGPGNTHYMKNAFYNYTTNIGIGESNYPLYSGDSARNYRYFTDKHNIGRYGQKSLGINFAARVKINDLMQVLSSNFQLSFKDPTSMTETERRSYIAPKIKVNDFSSTTARRNMLPYPKYYKVVYIMKLKKPVITEDTSVYKLVE